MKRLTLLLFFISGVIIAQNKEYTHSLSGIKKVRIETNTVTKIVALTGNSLTLKKYKPTHKDCDDCDYEHNYDHDHNFGINKKSKQDKRKGLTPIYPGGKDNTNGFGFSVTKEGNVLVVKDLKSHHQPNGIEVNIPKNIDIYVDTGNLGSAEIEGFISEEEANTNVGGITMKNVTGPITAHSSVGPITIDFSKISQLSPITISTSVSEIDVTIPSSTKADLDLKTNGTVYTNFDIEIPTKKGMNNVSRVNRITSSINNGGVKIKLKSSMGNIYLRKK